MALTSNTRVAWLNNGSKLSEEVKMENLEWCFQPMLICLRMFGIDFKWNQQRSSVTHNLIRLICLFWFIINVAVMCGIGLDLYEDMLKVKQTKYEKTSEKIKFLSYIVEIGGIYAAFLFSTRKYSQTLVDCFEQIEIQSVIDKKTYHQIRSSVVNGIYLSILTVKLKLTSYFQS